ncbi:restriction endonuclease [Streptomyces bikiniensis]|uniref:restriction endonuclease n=1 Tax=Streptomyces bikiniensis TaxID=1896 RepID=UPI000996923D|nr:restriction endonuclease [Streptomyces bikiniensis]
MGSIGEDRGPVRRGPAAIGRDLVLAIGLAGACVGGLALFFKTAEAAGDSGSGAPAALLVALAALGALAVGLALLRRGAAPVRRREAPRTVAAAPVPDVPDVGTEALDHTAVDPDGFEHTVAALCARDGCTPVEVVGGAGDLGADVIATSVDGRRVVLQCKQYAEDHRVGSQDLQRFGGTCFTVHGADVAVVVTTSSFTAPAAEYAATCGIVCVDGEALAAWTDRLAPPPWEALPVDPA